MKMYVELTGYKISPKPCRVAGQSDIEGTCMFVWECIKSEGTHVGVCVDSFMFGSCCVHNATDNSIGGGSTTMPHTSTVVRPAARPAIVGSPIESTSTRTTKPSSHGSTKPISTSQAGLQVYTSLATTRQPAWPSSSSVVLRPYLQKRPHLKPNNSPEQDRTDYHNHYHYNGNGSQITRRPQNGIAANYHEKRPEEDRHHGSGNLLHHHHHHLVGGFKDKVSNIHNTLLVRLPNKNSQQQGSTGKGPHHRPRPYQNKPVEDEKSDEQTQDLSVQETVHRPSINSVDDDVRKYFWVGLGRNQYIR